MKLKMRKSRNADVVTSSHNDSEEEQEQEQSVDSEDDWKPEKKKGAGAGGKGKRRSTTPATPKGRATKKSKKEESEEESEEEEEDESDDIEEEESDEEEGGGKAKKGGAGAKKARTSVGKNQPDKDGNLELYLFKNDLTKDFRSDEKLCLWRRDGASLLQKYMVVTEDSQVNDIVFKSSSVYSCWEEKRKNDFFQIKVQLIGDKKEEKKEGKVRVVDIAEFQRYAVEDRPKVDITPKGAEGGENYEEGSEEEYDEEDDE